MTLTPESHPRRAEGLAWLAGMSSYCGEWTAIWPPGLHASCSILRFAPQAVGKAEGFWALEFVPASGPPQVGASRLQTLKPTCPPPAPGGGGGALPTGPLLPGAPCGF